MGSAKRIGITKKKLLRAKLFKSLERNSKAIAKWPLWKQKLVPTWIKKNVGKRDIENKES